METTVALIGVSSALLGTVLGGLISHLSNRDIKKKEWRLGVLRDEITVRKKLYADLLTETTRLVVYSYDNKISSIKELDGLNNIFAQIELTSSPSVVNSAKTVVDHILHLHTKGEKKIEANYYDLKSIFITEVKREMRELSDI